MSGKAKLSYSRLDPTTGRIEWVDPSDDSPPAKRVRTRLETDSEVYDRFRAANTGMPPIKGFTGDGLDRHLKEIGFPPRKLIEEAA